MSAAAWVIGSALLIVFLGAWVAAWLDDRQWSREFDADHREPPSRLDRLDRGEDPWLP